MAYDFSLSELENSPQFKQSSFETQKSVVREYIAQNGPDEALKQFNEAISSPDFAALAPDQQQTFRQSYRDFYGVDLPTEKVSLGTDIKDVAMAGLAGTSAIPKAASIVAGWFGADDMKSTLQDIAKTTEDFYRSKISAQGKEVEQQPFLSEQDGKWFGDNAIKKVFMVSAESLPLMVATAPIGGGASTALSKAKFLPEFIRAVEGGSKTGKWAHDLIAFGGSEAGTSALVSAADAGQKIQNADERILANSPAYRALLEQGLDPAAARAELRGIVEEETVKTQFAATLAGSALAPGGAMPKLFQKSGKAGLVRETLGGIKKEMGEEVLQSPLEQVGQNITTQRTLDPSQPTLQGAGEAAALGIASAGVTGSAFGGGSKLLTLGQAQQIASSVPIGANPEQAAAAINAAVASTETPRTGLGDLTPDEIDGIAAVQQRFATADLPTVQQAINETLPRLRENNPAVAAHIEPILAARLQALQSAEVPVEPPVPAAEVPVEPPVPAAEESVEQPAPAAEVPVDAPISTAPLTSAPQEVAPTVDVPSAQATTAPSQGEASSIVDLARAGKGVSAEELAKYPDLLAELESDVNEWRRVFGSSPDGTVAYAIVGKTEDEASGDEGGTGNGQGRDKKTIPTADSKLSTIEEIDARIQSIHRQRQALDDTPPPRRSTGYSQDRRNNAYKNFADRLDFLQKRKKELLRPSTQPVSTAGAGEPGSAPPALQVIRGNRITDGADDQQADRADYWRESPPMVSAPTAIKSVPGGKEYILPGIENLRVVVKPPSGSAKKSNKAGWSVYVADNLIWSNTPGVADTADTAIKNARGRLEKIYRSTKDQQKPALPTPLDAKRTSQGADNGTIRDSGNQNTQRQAAGEVQNSPTGAETNQGTSQAAPENIRGLIATDSQSIAAVAGKEDWEMAPEEYRLPPSKKEIPTIGHSFDEIWDGWKKVSSTYYSGQGANGRGAVGVGFNVHDGGVYSWKDGKVVKEEKHKTRRGYVATYRDATKSEIAGIRGAINDGAFQIEKRSISGALGLAGTSSHFGSTVEVVHQANGRPLHEAIVRKALSERKMVPDEVLRSYPDLVEEYGRPQSAVKSIAAGQEVNTTPTPVEPKARSSFPAKDADLTTIEELTERIKSVEDQREKLNSVLNPRDHAAHQAKIAKLTARHDELWARRAKLVKEQRAATQTNVSEPAVKSIAAGQEVNTTPTPAQADAGNYRKAHVTLDGMNLSIENPVGSMRSGTDDSGRAWSQELKADYGYIRGTQGKDKDHLDIFVKPGYTGGAADVFVVNQFRRNGTFDEHKTVVGVANEQEAIDLYNANYEAGWAGGRSVTRVPVETFRKWAAGPGPKRGPLVRRGTVNVGQQKPTEPAATQTNVSEPAVAETKPAQPVTSETKSQAKGQGRGLLDEHRAVVSSINNGNITVEKYRQAFEDTITNRADITADLQKLTKDQLLSMMGPARAYRYKNDKKDAIVRSAYLDMLDDFNLTDSLSFAVGGGNYEQSMIGALRGKVNAVTEQSLSEYAASVKAAEEKLAESRAAAAEGMQDPKTIDDFVRVMRAMMEDGKTYPEARMTLTPEQRETYDRLSGEKSRGERKARADQQKTEIRTAAVSTEGEIVETKHTKTGEDLFVVKAAERVDREIYNQWNATAKRLGGYYSSFRGRGAVPGFQFKTKENAQAFLDYIGGNAENAKTVAKERRDAFTDNKEQSAVERLREMAEALNVRAEESLSRDRLANTSRRARMAAAAEAAAESDRALAKTMENIADAIENGKADFLDRVRQKVQVEALRSYVNQAKYKELSERYPAYIDREKHKGEPPTKETADYADFPRYTAFRSDLAKLGRQLQETQGTKQLGKRLLEVADDVTDVYVKFAKDNLLKVSGFVTKDGGLVPAFKTLKNAEESIDRSGYRGKAIAIRTKPGEIRIVLSPSEAKARGIWKGDDDKRIILSDTFGEELIAKASRKDVEVPWYFDSVRQNKARLKGMGIETPQEFRAALREFTTLQQQPAKPDKIKELERSMVGRKNDGLDFFPTPTDTAQTMVDTADIKGGMTVLEPSAGMGHIAEVIRDSGFEPDVVEVSSSRRELLDLKGFNVVGQDFLDLDTGYDRIIMNPPFSDRRDVEHVRHAYRLLNPGGRLVAIMGEGSFFGSDKKATEFRAWLEELGGTSEKLEEGTFLDKSLPVNTGVAARMVVIDKPSTAPKLSRTAATTGPTADIRAEITERLGSDDLFTSGMVTIISPEEAEQIANGRLSFAGPLSINPGIAALEKARSMSDDGASPEEIFSNTGWFRALDGKWRFEIDDKNAKWSPGFISRIKNRLNRPIKISDVLSHPKLFKAYPQLKDIKFEFFSPNDGTLGEFLPEENTIRLAEVFQSSPGVKNPIETILLHELQHAIQSIEGFGSGANVDMFLTTKDNHQPLLDRLAEILSSDSRLRSLDSDFEDLVYGEMFSDSAQDEDIKYENLISEFNKTAEGRELLAIYDALRETERYSTEAYEDAFRKYYFTHGEIEARFVQDRFLGDNTDNPAKFWADRIFDEISILYSKNGNIQGITTPDGKVYLVEGNIASGRAWSVLLHELGTHAGRLMTNEKEWQQLAQAVERRRGTDPLLQEAYARVPDDTGLIGDETYDELSPERKVEVDALRTEEAIAYLVENHPDVGIVRRVIALVKRMLVKMGMSPERFTAADLRALAESAVRRRVTGVTAERGRMLSQVEAAQFKPVDPNSKEFKEWFGGSVVTENGKAGGRPLRVYHGTPNGNFEERAKRINAYRDRLLAKRNEIKLDADAAHSLFLEVKKEARDYYDDNAERAKRIEAAPLHKRGEMYKEYAERQRQLDRDEAFARDMWVSLRKEQENFGRDIVLKEDEIDAFLRKGDNDSGYLGSGFYFTADKGVAGRYAQMTARGRLPGETKDPYIYEVYISIANPFYEGKTSYTPEMAKVEAEFYERFKPWRPDINGFAAARSQAKAEMLKQFGFDGVIGESAGKEGVEYVVFSPTQIKSAISNTGAFSKTDPRIRYSVAAPPSPTQTPPDWIDRFLAAHPTIADQWERFLYGIVDTNDPRRRVMQRAEAINTSENLSENTDILTIERLRGKKTAEEVKRFMDDTLEPMLRDLARAKLAPADLDEYAHAKHTPERNLRMQQVNAKRFIDMVAAHLNSAEREALDNRIIDIRSDVLMTGGTRADRQNQYLDVLAELFDGIETQRLALEAEQTALDNRQFTPAEIAKGTPDNLQKRIDSRSRHLDEVEKVRTQWERESPRFAGITNDEAADIVTKWEADPRFEAMTKAHQQLLDFGQMKLDILRESGQLSDAEYKSLTDGYEFYVPLHRDVGTDDRPVTGRITGPTGKPIKVAKGSMLEVVHILAHSVQNVQTAINRKHKADAGRVLLNFAKENPDAGISVAEQAKKPTHDAEGNIVMYVEPREGDNELYIRVDGKRYTLTFDTKNETTKRFLESIKDSDSSLSGPMQALSKMVRFLASVNTTLSPEFVISNFLRDIQTAGVHLEDTDAKGLQAKVLKNVFPAIKGILGAEYGKANTYWGRVYRDFAANGGKIGWMQSYDGIKDLAGQIESTMNLYRDGHVPKKALHTILSAIERTNTAVENGVRLAVYDQLIKAGAAPSKAALTAANLTVDFTRRGAQSPALNALYMFFNAGVQGNVRMIKAFARSNRVKAITVGIVATGAALQMLAYATGGDDETGQPYVDGIPDFIRERNMVIMIPDSGGKYTKIPMPYGYNLFFNTGAEIARAFHDATTGRKYEPGKAATRILTAAMGTFNPLQSATLAQALSPTILDPVVQVAENKNWSGANLMPEEPDYGPGKANAYRHWKSVSPVAKSVAQGLHRLTGGKGEYDNTAVVDVSPEVIEMMYETITGSAGRFVKDFVSTPVQMATSDEPIKSEKIPLVRRVYGQWTNRSITDRYYEEVDKVERFKKDFLLADAAGRKEMSTDPRYKMVGLTKDAEARLTKLREAKNKAEKAGRPTKTIDDLIIATQTEYLKRSAKWEN